MSWNILLGGYDGPDTRRLEQQMALVRALRPDVLLLQECKDYLADGMRRCFAFEAGTGLRGFIADPQDTGMSTGVFVNGRLQPLYLSGAATHFHHAVATLTARLDENPVPLQFVSAHLCPYGADMRAKEAYYLAAGAKPGAWSVLGADFNSLSPHDPEPQGMDELPPLFRVRRRAAEGAGFDRRPLQIMAQAGWRDLGQDDPRPTVPAPAFSGGEFIPFRCDYMLATEALAARRRRFEVIDDARTASASDHLPLLAEFEF